MTRITNADQILLLLRAHLQRAEHARKGRKASGAAKGAPRGAVARLQDIANGEDLSEAVLARALIAGLLSDEFGADVANDVSFQTMVDQVTEIISRDAAGEALLKKAVAQLAKT